METKRCFKCGKELPISEFYKHPRMADGHLNKCKECTRIDVHDKYIENIKSSEYVEKERKRGREKYARLGYVFRITESREKKYEKYKTLRNARRMFKKYSLSKDVELHHWNYNLMDQVIALNKRLHKRIHCLMAFNLELGYYFKDGEPLDTLEKHLSVVRFVCERDGFDYSKVQVLKI